MTRKELDKFLDFLDKHDCWIFTIQTAEICFQEDPNTLRHSLARHVRNEAIIRLARGLYANLRSKAMPLYALEDMVRYLRPLNTSYLSQESRLSELSVISQVPTRLTVMTTGRSQIFNTPIGTIELTHTNRKLSNCQDFLKYDRHRNIFVASPKTALDDLRNAKRNMGLVDFDEYEIAQEEWESQENS
jgi:predicted transcriptional regulator of viral defense system